MHGQLKRILKSELLNLMILVADSLQSDALNSSLNCTKNLQ